MPPVHPLGRPEPAAGPSATASWQREAVATGAGASRWLRTIRDATSPAVRYGLPERLAVARDDRGRPVLDLVLRLTRHPLPTEEDVGPLLAGGHLAADLTLEGPDLPGLRPLFPREVVVELCRAGETLARTEAAGTDRLALAADLGRDDALAVLGGLDGAPTGLDLLAVVTYRAHGGTQQVRLTGRWTDVWEFLHGCPDRLDEHTLRSAYDRLLDSGILVASQPGSSGSLYGPFRAMAGAVVVERTAEPDGHELRLRPRPSPLFGIDLTARSSGDVLATTSIGGPLEDTLAGLQVDRAAHVRLVAATPGGDQPVPERRSYRGGTRSDRGPATPRPEPLASLGEGGRLVATSVAVRPSIEVDRPHQLLLDESVSGVDLGMAGGRQWWLHDLKFRRPPDGEVEPELGPLPMVDHPAAWAWPDASDPASWWSAPTFELVIPAPTAQPGGSPFRYSFRSLGVTADGRPALEAKLQVTLRRTVSPLAMAALAAHGSPPSRPLPTDGASLTFELPFVDETGATRRQSFPMATTEAGDRLVGTLTLLHDWARLAYGALSQAGFQATPARVSVAWSFVGYVELTAGTWELVHGGKLAHLPLRFHEGPADPVVDTPYFDATRTAYVADGAMVTLRGEFSVPEAQLVNPDLGVRARWATRTFLRTQSIDVLVPCQTHGALYEEETAGGPVAVGCRDALTLGRTTWRQYDELPALATRWYRVFRSLQQPGRYLVVPAAYAITRVAPGQGERSLRPAILLYALLDPAVPGNNQVVVQARLEPDIPAFARVELTARLASLSAAPVVDYATGVEAVTTYAWSIDGSVSVEVDTVRLPDGFQVGLATDLHHALLLRDLLRTAGVVGAVVFRLPDRTELRSTLLLALDSVIGPWEEGPVSVSLDGQTATLANRLERPVVVTDLLGRDAHGELVRAPAEAALAAGATAVATVPPGLREVWPVYTLPRTGAAALEEVRSFIEDVTTDVIFLDLINHDEHGIARLDVQARLAGVAGTAEVPVTGSPPVGTASFVLPLTTYLQRRVLQWQATTTLTGGATVESDWHDWDLATRGSIVSITWDAAAPAPKEAGMKQRKRNDRAARGAAPAGPEITYYPNDGDGRATLDIDPTRFALTFGPERVALSRDAVELLREHAAPVGQVQHYGMRIYQSDSAAARERAVRVLDAEEAVEYATPVLRRDGRDVYITRRFVVQFRPEVTQEQIDELNSRYGVQVVQPLGYAANGFLLEAPQGGLQAIELANAYRETGLVIFAHPDLISRRHKRTGTAVSAPPAPRTEPVPRPAEARAERAAAYLARQWHLRSARVTDAWSITRGSPDIRIAVMDDGLDTAHAEFAGRIGPQADFAADVSDARPKLADDNHGTACVGVAAAGGVRASGAAPGCTLMPIRFPATLGDADEAEMFRWAADEGAKVISCSWGPTDGRGTTDPLPGATQAAIRYCVHDHKIPVLFAAGNGAESVDLDGYAANPDVMAIAACTNSDQHSWYSDTGVAVCVCAPSNGDASAGDLAILTTDRSGAAGYNGGTANLDAGYTDTFGGTSSATPLVAGVVALIRSVDPGLTPGQIRQILKDTAIKIGDRAGYGADGHSPDFGHGKVDAAAAVRAAQAGGSGTHPSGASIMAVDASVARGGPAPVFEVDPGSGNAIYYGVEVVTDPALFQGGNRTAANWYASYEHGPLLASSPWTLPADAWAALQGASALYYRAWFSSSATAWVDYSVTPASSLAIGPGGVRTRRRRVAPPPGPRIHGPERVARSGAPPTFHLHLAGDRYFAVEVAVDARLLDRSENRPLDPTAFYGTWQTGTAEADTDVEFQLPAEAWERLRSADVLFYRLLTTDTPPSPDGWTGVRASTPDGLAEQAPYLLVTDMAAPSAAAERDTTQPHVLDPDELLWRRRPVSADG